MSDPRENRIRLKFILNGAEVERETATSTLLTDLLRDEFDLAGVKYSCGRAVCGACTILIDGQPVASCAKFAFEVDGANVTTIEGMAEPDGTLDPVQEAFAKCSALQCGYCTPGMILLTRALLETDPDPDDATIVKWISSNVCRCTGYQMIVEAVHEAARLTRAGTSGAAP